MGAQEQGAEATSGRWLVMPRTLVFVLHDDAVLMMKRAPHRRVFPNQYNGLGGHLERGESPAAGALREVREESGLKVNSLRLRSIHNIDTGAQTGILLFVYTAISAGRAVRCDGDEGKLEWIPRERLGALDLVDDLPGLLPRLLTMRNDDPPLNVHVSYDETDRVVMRYDDEA
ncbi:MAG: NUDIX domain-containing protein [Chloroflexi bacterium]|nr:NUDIX domain-containing protein [Chloroflexota bacterium]MCY3583804.1 NUDIX domain-containing protein [Chloroflexota bacterium]MCY3716264.1 NUDIX domain-containing protein [Chloroflexota bacterium]MDE2650407.1 NUDIX domain-containing protein [Chloroflexota bacterium]MXV92613.1 NUDIX domain-containing protein [Chloroflexota bacterium]